MKYLPLCGMILAFVIGRELGAEDEPAAEGGGKIVTVDILKANAIVLEDERGRATIAPRYIQFQDRRNGAEVGVGSFGMRIGSRNPQSGAERTHVVIHGEGVRVLDETSAQTMDLGASGMHLVSKGTRVGSMTISEKGEALVQLLRANRSVLSELTANGVEFVDIKEGAELYLGHEDGHSSLLFTDTRGKPRILISQRAKHTGISVIAADGIQRADVTPPK